VAKVFWLIVSEYTKLGIDKKFQKLATYPRSLLRPSVNLLIVVQVDLQIIA
jgi:hypothetical protein